MSEQEELRQLELPDRRKHTYAGLSKRLDQHLEYIENRLRRFFTRALGAFAIIGITSALAIFGYGIVLREVQQQRRDSCLAQNKQHVDTKKQLIELAAADEAMSKTPTQVAEVRRRRDVTLRLIDTLAPIQDCRRIAPEGRILP